MVQRAEERLSREQGDHVKYVLPGLNSQMLTQAYVMDYNVPFECCRVVLKCLEAGQREVCEVIFCFVVQWNQ